MLPFRRSYDINLGKSRVQGYSIVLSSQHSNLVASASFTVSIVRLARAPPRRNSVALVTVGTTEACLILFTEIELHMNTHPFLWDSYPLKQSFPNVIHAQ